MEKDDPIFCDGVLLFFMIRKHVFSYEMRVVMVLSFGNLLVNRQYMWRVQRAPKINKVNLPPFPDFESSVSLPEVGRFL